MTGHKIRERMPNEPASPERWNKVGKGSRQPEWQVGKLQSQKSECNIQRHCQLAATHHSPRCWVKFAFSSLTFVLRFFITFLWLSSSDSSSISRMQNCAPINYFLAWPTRCPPFGIPGFPHSWHLGILATGHQLCQPVKLVCTKHGKKLHRDIYNIRDNIGSLISIIFTID